MLGVNLHHVVRGVITAIHPDEDCILYQADGQINYRGDIKPIYKEPVEIKANIQPLGEQALRQLERIEDTEATEQIFVYSNLNFPVSGLQRIPILRGGDIVQRADKTYWLITSVIEDWSQDGWANAGITQQVTPPDFSVCDWWDGDLIAQCGI